MQDAELRYTPKGSAFCDFVLASNRYEGLVLRGHHLVAPGQGLRRVTVEWPGVRVVGRQKQDRWAGPEGQVKEGNKLKEAASSACAVPFVLSRGHGACFIATH